MFDSPTICPTCYWSVSKSREISQLSLAEAEAEARKPSATALIVAQPQPLLDETTYNPNYLLCNSAPIASHFESTTRIQPPSTQSVNLLLQPSARTPEP
jgi:hypothetical protein